ncbi:MAG: hypothetical protein HRU06_06175 [Oceanospirillaceae bacterium]|nr:hypothetical protein [Oceanospirillaceae bacterium]
MIDYFGIENIVVCLVFIVIAIIYQVDRSSKHSFNHIDTLQSRVYELEERIGIKAFDSDPIGFVRKEDKKTNI